MVSSLRGSRTIPFLYGRQSMRKLLNMLFDCLKTLRTDDVLDAAGVVVGDVLRDAEIFQNLGDHLMPLVDHLRDRSPLIGKINVSGVSHSDLIPFPQMLMAMLTLDFLKSSSLATSTERTTGSFSLNIKIVSRYISADSLLFSLNIITSIRFLAYGILHRLYERCR